MALQEIDKCRHARRQIQLFRVHGKNIGRRQAPLGQHAHQPARTQIRRHIPLRALHDALPVQRPIERNLAMVGTELAAHLDAFLRPPLIQGPVAIGSVIFTQHDALVAGRSRGTASGGRPRKYWGAAHSQRSLAAIRRAYSRESGSAPMRMPTSKAVSARLAGRSLTCNCTSTSGYSRANAVIAGPIWRRPKPMLAFTRNRPRGTARLAVTVLSSSSISARMREPCAKYSSPSCVTLMRRVLRFSRRTPSRASRLARVLLITGGVTPISRATAAMLPCLTSMAKKARSETALILYPKERIGLSWTHYIAVKLS